ncbi:MAG: homoserine dehydrogenase [Labrys sp. (in: a-proteobacteria)]|jgi:homoserine dehydrogenase
MAKSLRLGIAGLGTVGANVVRLVKERADAIEAATGCRVSVTAVSARDSSRDRGIDLAGVTWFDDPVALARASDVDCVVELIGGSDGPALAVVDQALSLARPVVTANKALLARHGLALAEKAEAAGVALAFEASSAGGIPVVKTLREALPGNRISRISGILNGTCNYILTQMEMQRVPFSEALAEAQRLGYAEADPTFDIGGFDTAHKLSILASLAFGTRIDAEAIHVEGISAIAPLDLAMAEEFGFRIKLLGVAARVGQGLEQRVHPTMVAKSQSIAQVMGVTNAVMIDADAVRQLTLIGPGAGGAATASAVLADIADVARGTAGAPFGRPLAQLEAAQPAPMQRHEGGYYVRLDVLDKRGAFAAIAGRMSENGISLESIVQKGKPKSTSVPVILFTHATTEAAIRRALEGVMADRLVTMVPQVIRIERE